MINLYNIYNINYNLITKELIINKNEYKKRSEKIKFNRHYTFDDIKELFNKKIDNSIIKKRKINKNTIIKVSKNFKESNILKQSLITNYF